MPPKIIPLLLLLVGDAARLDVARAAEEADLLGGGARRDCDRWRRGAEARAAAEVELGTDARRPRPRAQPRVQFADRRVPRDLRAKVAAAAAHPHAERPARRYPRPPRRAVEREVDLQPRRSCCSSRDGGGGGGGGGGALPRKSASRRVQLAGSPATARSARFSASRSLASQSLSTIA